MRRPSRSARPFTRPLRITVRAATPEDREAVQQLWREVDELHARLWPRFFRVEPRHAGSAALLAAGSDDEVLLVADLDGAAVGLAHAQVFDTPDVPTLVRRRRVHIEDIVVASHARKRGIGQQLVRAVKAWAKEKRAEEIVLVVWEGNRSATRFYRALGFSPVHRVLGLEI